MEERQTVAIPATELRARAARCFALAAAMSSPEEAETLMAFGREYLEMAARLETITVVATSTPETGRS
jgi:NaMN:DMB phosphoribosyltransferase